MTLVSQPYQSTCMISISRAIANCVGFRLRFVVETSGDV